MRILHVNKFLYNRGGAETVYFATSDLLRDHGHEVIPFAMADERNMPSEYARYFVSNVDLRSRSASAGAQLRAAARIIYSREAERKIDELISDARPEIAHLHNIYHQLSPSILRTLARRGVPAVMTLHDYKLVCPAYTLHTEGRICERCNGHSYYNAVLHKCVQGSRLKSAICAAEGYLHTALGSYRRHIEFFIAPSLFLAEKLKDFGLPERRIAYAPNFIDASRYPASSAGGGYLLYAGRLETVKGVATLLEAVAGSPLARSHGLRIAGDGPERERLEAYSRAARLTNVRFLGHLSQAELAPVVDGALFSIVPSEWYENAPMSVLESAARGKAIIASDLGGLPELVKHGETGLLFPPGDALALRLAIEELLRDPARIHEMGMRARSLIERSFSPQRHYSDLMAIYERALAPHEMRRAIQQEVSV